MAKAMTLQTEQLEPDRLKPDRRSERSAQPALQETPLRAEPIPASERIVTLDVLRGIALWGILFVNVSATSQPADWFGVAWNEIGPVDYLTEVLKLFFVQGKFYTLFAFLFGVGFAVQLGRAESRGQRFAWRFLWRMVILFGIGFAHIIFLWDGDILNTYAVGGIFLLIFYGIKRLFDRAWRRLTKGRRERLHRRWILIAAGCLILLPLALFGGLMQYGMSLRSDVARGERGAEELTGVDRDAWKLMNEGEEKLAEYRRGEKIEEVNAIFAEGEYSDVVAHRLGAWPQKVLAGPFWLMIAGIFAIGAYFGRQRLISRAEELKAGFRRLMVGGFALGAPISLLFVVYTIAAAEVEKISWYFWLQILTKTLSGLAFALAYVAVITLAMFTSARRWLEWFAPVGRTALSNYLLQSLVNTTVFYGYGLGLLGKLGAFQQVVYLSLFFAAQVLLSRWWLKYFRYGPVEWLWRSLTYLRWQPMRAVAVQ